MAVTWTGYGSVAHEALRRTVADAKDGDLLTPVTVLVPTNLAGVLARRSLAGGVHGRPGIAGLAVLTVDRLAEQVAAAALVGAGRRPATEAVLAAAWRRALAEEPGLFAPVAQHPTTVRALAAAHRQLREVDEAGLSAISANGGPIAANLVRLHHRVVTTLAAGWYDVSDLRRAATEALGRNPRVADEIGTVVFFLPDELPPGAVAFLAQLASVTDLHVVAARTGDTRVDATTMSSLRWLGPAARMAEFPPPIAAGVLHASDADDEVRCVIRLLTGALQQAPAHRVAVLYGSASPYARLLAEHLDAAGIAWNGTGVRPTIERSLARAFLDLLALPEHGWRRDEVMAVLASAPVRDAAGRRVPAARWERISRSAGVVAGDDWDIRLKAYATQERLAAGTERACEAPRQEVISRRESDADIADALRQFVGELRERLHEGESLTAWPALSAWAQRTYGALVGNLDAEAWLPEDELRAADKVARSLAGMAGLGAVAAAADLTALRLTLELELAADLPRHGRFGEGVLVAPLSAAVGLDVDIVYVLGLAEELVPGRLGTDALLPDEVRALTGGQLPLLRDRVDRQHRHLLAALAAAPEVVVSFPRGDLRQSTTRLPSRWLLPTLRSRSGNGSVDATRWQSARGDFLVGSPSFAASLTGSDELATLQEWRTRAAVAAHTRDIPLEQTLPGDDVVAAALDMRRGHASDRLTRFDGDLAGLDVPDPTAGAVLSPTALEAWTRCPHRYFAARLLRVSPVESPEELLHISPLEVGNLMHLALDRFFAAQAEAGAVPAGNTPWSDAQRADLQRIASEVAAELAVRGVTGHRLLWRQELTRILADLNLFLDDDEQLRAATGRGQVRSELAFGMRGALPVEVALHDGRTVFLRGSADRVDRAGDAIVVVDYKTGSSRSFADLDQTDPTARGTKLQLPVYGYAARAALDAPQAAVTAEYWFLRKDRGRRIALVLDEPTEHTFAETLGVIVDGIAAGLFPHRPPDEDGWGGHVECPYCDPDGLGVAELRTRWSHKRSDPRLAAYLSLIDPDVTR
ncbi:PD-(D/E)XK nuclease family protein [Couchioplanes caeruleus]|uniref:PD-(D/E)XK endonuclease-like domain-containing protein n=2 Tax=Couchioplanes caeruleus TaxID=56438 RepID=A0A1K0GSM8_9ACTN|nr:PD-(D/E)XK nuclease family protein [Couchioplanes caeruleus]OJF14220.1 hypothetical protein BG844_10920 [Couchioplanes caeruleus subsp. caeruleus]ROP31049.1 PD-(D/E)XK nuclease superfamily protein [Couchioplanes caeruleus]